MDYYYLYNIILYYYESIPWKLKQEHNWYGIWFTAEKYQEQKNGKKREVSAPTLLKAYWETAVSKIHSRKRK